MGIHYDNYLAHYGVKGMKWGNRLAEQVEDGLNSAAQQARNTAQEALNNNPDAAAALGELKTAISGGDDGYGGLATVMGSEENALKLVNAAAAAGEAGRLGMAAVEEIKVSADGGDFGYGALADVLGDKKAARNVVNAAAKAGELKRSADKKLSKLNSDTVNSVRRFDKSVQFQMSKWKPKAMKQTSIDYGDFLDLYFGDVTYNNYIMHYGVKGMKWGVRKSDRFSKLGSMANRLRRGDRSSDQRIETESGSIVTSKKGKVKRVELNDQTLNESRTISADKRQAVLTERKIREGSLDSISNKDLQALITRKNLEAQYTSLVSRESENGLASLGKSVVKDVGRDYMRQVIKTTVSETAKSYFKEDSGNNPYRKIFA